MTHLSPQNRLRVLRKECGLTLEQVSQATGLAFQLVRSAETKGTDIKLGTAFRLAQFYGLPLENIWQPLYGRISGEVTPSLQPASKE